MSCDYISRKVALIFDNLIVRVVNDKILCSRDGTVVEGIAYSATPANGMFGIMAIGDMYIEMTSIPQYINYRLSMMKYQGYKVAKACISVHANCSLSHCIATG